MNLQDWPHCIHSPFLKLLVVFWKLWQFLRSLDVDWIDPGESGPWSLVGELDTVIVSKINIVISYVSYPPPYICDPNNQFLDRCWTVAMVTVPLECSGSVFLSVNSFSHMLNLLVETREGS